MRLHVSMRVDDLAEAIAFYSALFNQEPSFVQDDYAKWDVDDPNVNFVVEKSSNGSAPGVDHFGIQVEDAGQLQSISQRMNDSGHPYLGIERGTCCYADIEKSWVKGPTGDKWETFLTHSQTAEKYGEDREHLLDAM